MTAPYQPTPSEVAVAVSRGPELKLSGDGVFATLQGEGVTAGQPSVFIRLQNCNLQCGADGNGWRCDAWYTWDETTPEYWQETRLVAVDEAASEIREAWSSTFDDEVLGPNLVITGGEPLLQQKKISQLLPLLPGWSVEVETNGTVVPHDSLVDAQINCSPKLASSGNALPVRRRLQALRAIAGLPNHWFKFVVSDPEEDVAEITELMGHVNGGDFSRVLLMSEGVDAESLSRNDEQLGTIAQRLGCMVTARNHIFWFGDKRAT